MKVFCYHGRTTPEVSSKLYFAEICQVSEKLWLFNHKRADFWFPNFGFKRSLLSFLNKLFVQQCSLNQNNSAFPRFVSRYNTVLENTEIDPSKVLKIVRSLDSNKAHGWDSLSISMIKIRIAEIVIPLCLIYEKCLATGKFPEIWKKANVLRIHKKESRQVKNNYRPISLLPICGKIFKKLILTASMNISQITSSSLQNNQAFDQVIRLSISFYISLITSILPLKNIHHVKQELFS